MARDVILPPHLGVIIKFIEPELGTEEIATEARYLREDLLDLSGLEHTRFDLLKGVRNEVAFAEGVRFQVAADRLRAVLKRLCDRLDDNPLETLILIQQGQTKLQIQTHQAEELEGIVAAADALLPAEQVYRAKAETYSRTYGELSPAEEANLDLLRQRLNLSREVAEALKAEALGPFKTLDEKRRHFQDVLLVEVAREFPLSEDTWAVLLELADNLGLPQAKAKAIYQDHLHQIKAKIEATRQQAEAEAEAARQRAAEEAEKQARVGQQVSRQQQLEEYRQIFRQAIQTTLYPLAFDQGRLEQARQLWSIAPDDVTRLEEAVRSELYGTIQSALGVDYSRLRQLLWNKAWKEADEETEAVMLKALRPNNLEPLDRDALLQLPCVDLLTIDQLWSRYSGGRFGFQAQHQIFAQQVDRRPADFLRALGWQDGPVGLTGGLKPYQKLQFSAGAPPGHLPTWRWCCPSLESGYSVGHSVVEGLFLHLEKCLPTQGPLPLADLTALREGA
ncbi:MAG: GUN4 domain-containing protein [Nodosilinea sp.]